MTKHDETQRRSISDRQSRAIDLLLTGESLTGVASSLGISRQCVSGWLNHHAPFIAELNHRRHQHHLAVRSRYERAVGLALDVVIDALEGGNERLAVTVLKTAGRHLMESGTAPEPQSVSGVVLSLARQKEVEALMYLTIAPNQVAVIEEESRLQGDAPGQDP